MSDVPLEFFDPDGVAVDLTDATVYLVAKTKLSDADADAVIDVAQDTHTAANEGRTTLPIDLSELAAAYFTDLTRLTGSIWIIDSQSQRIPWGNLSIEIHPSAKLWTA
jgi:hypothetical protein